MNALLLAGFESEHGEAVVGIDRDLVPDVDGHAKALIESIEVARTRNVRSFESADGVHDELGPLHGLRAKQSTLGQRGDRRWREQLCQVVEHFRVTLEVD